MNMTTAAAALGVSYRTLARIVADRPELVRKIGRELRMQPGALDTLRRERSQ